ncbi:unnamed protein product [Aureobasidium mustum]|uniref:Uncharacterized protein n=1 Tax=Aureobasidium mustum TaxID=2773714 RepID=A0A9N8JZM8_9PEZI|nr:unnamed protein product [Aureobasidium mustum]
MADQKTENQQSQQPSPSQMLPSIAALTNGLPSSNQYSPPNRQPSHLPSRDSGTWPPIHPQMKRKSAPRILNIIISTHQDHCYYARAVALALTDFPCLLI